MASDTSLLGADGSPERIGVRRLNHIPLYIVGGILVVVVFLVTWVAVEKGKEQAPKDSTDHGGSASDFASQVVGRRVGYVQSEQVATPMPAPTPAPTAAAVAQPTPEGNELAARKKAFYEALFAQSSVSVPEAVPQQEAMSPTEAGRAIPVEPAEIPRAPGASPTPRDPNSLATYQGTKDRWTLNSRPQPPVSPYVVQTGSVIPALLISGMESELPGTVVAQVSEDVFDSPTGQHLLIPQGAKLVGEYGNMIQYGQARIFVAWQRLDFPDGWTLDIGAQPGVDGQGEAGFHDEVDNHFIRLFSSALLMSAISGGIALSQQGYNGGYEAPNAGSVLSAALGQQLGAATSALLEKNLSIPPTLKIRPGYRFFVIAIKDLVFDRPYVVPDY